MTLLDGIHGPGDLRGLSAPELDRLAAEIREFLVERVSRTGGHLGPNLGVVELTLALHRVFDSPRDTLVFDTGHQAYVHKLLTGRQDFDRLRHRGGLSGYPSRAESGHDVVENSHASTSLSWADGIAHARALAGEGDRTVVAVIGDGALTGGMAWEALNNIADGSPRRLVVVVNDNGRSYAPTVGGMMRRGVEGIVKELGLSYIGPVDGHDVTGLEIALRGARAAGGPVVVHALTEKGRGYAPAEQDATDRFHAVGRIHPETGLPVVPSRFGWTGVFAEEIVALGRRRPDLVAITAAMREPVGLAPFAAAFPDRILDVGIAEQHALTTAAGMAYAGLHPVVALYATFLNRAFDQVLLDAALHRAGVTIVLDRAGITGDDGPSHHGMWDLALLSLVPGLRLAAPRDGRTLRRALREAVDVADAPTVLRYPKGALPADVPAVAVRDGLDVLAHRDGPDPVLIVAVGAMVPTALAVADALDRGVTVVDPRWVLPVSPALVSLAAEHAEVAVIEDGLRQGGVGSAVALAVRDVPVRAFGLPAEFLAHGSRDEVLAAAGLTAERVAAELRR
ncbi:1-deoxy-D-xylulose-5-phosphate synthase [Cellulomonas denverensis]|uniref:1-deoxy-D-xylulose-5-phosphate synthase n=1 Tax=Cellulomonas denverensis TaxID=264297 RepID=A0A7X6KW22_9CELL|nr:1-deoxy-D-xylulose-5-phosphate synthase [Cellulomonas denverensis]NKY23339.1 1-deoxy-D-xylulose-5-phosphate synthase [Cellulomonas denverensis]GIG24372.1 1-deoxy-D-xylulose-5-phosphate synthase 2 [Cellulomonas denverensis]